MKTRRSSSIVPKLEIERAKQAQCVAEAWPTRYFNLDLLFSESTSARNDATLSTSVGSLFRIPLFLQRLRELARF